MIVFFFFSSRRRHTSSLRDWSSDVCSSDLIGSTTAKDKPIKAADYVTEIGFITSLKLGDGTARITYVGKGLPHCGPVHVPVTQVDPRVSIFLALEILDVNLDDAVSQGVNPVLRITVKEHVPHVEPGFYPRTLKLTNIFGHLKRAQEEFVPNFFDGDHHF